jgi:5-methylcytosine-specific restriction endonuclease McrA
MFTNTVDHSCLEMEHKKIPKKVRHDVWDKRFSNQTSGTCFCCESIVSIHEFHCGHIVSQHDHGTNTVDNLEVVCIKCNLDMSTMNMEQYKTKFK